MTIQNAIDLVAVSGVRQHDGKLIIANEPYDSFPEQIVVEGVTFDFSEEEEVDSETKYCLGHYFRRGSGA